MQGADGERQIRSVKSERDSETLVFVLCAGVLPTWTGWTQQTSGTGNNVRCVHFMDASTGYGVGQNRTIM